MASLKYIAHYPQHIQSQVQSMIDNNQLDSYLKNNYPLTHQIQSDKALYDYVNDLKSQHLGKVGALSNVQYNNKLTTLKRALGMHTKQSRVQGRKLKSHNSIAVASVFKDAPLEFLQMIVVHELAHFKESEHNKAFYQLCLHMAADYHQWEFDTRLWLLSKSLSVDC